MISLVGELLGGVVSLFKKKQDLKKAVMDNKIRLAMSEQEYNREWEMKQLDNAGWKDDILFYAIIAMFIWSGFDPDGARVVFENWAVLPEWFIQMTMWLVASVIGVKKIGDYIPGLIGAVKEAVKK